jgi:hypothetical protein
MAYDSAPHGDDLETLARRRFGKLSEAEVRLVRAAPKGEVARCGPNFDRQDPANNPSDADAWGSDREIRAELVRWLCIDESALKKVDPRGVRVYAAKIVGNLDLSFAAVPFPLGLFRCRLAAGGEFRYIRVALLDLHGSLTGPLNIEGADVRGGVFLNNGFSAVGEVRLFEARIGTDLECRDGKFKNMGGRALSGDGVEVKGEVFLGRGFCAEGEVRLLGSRIGGNLDCSGGSLKNRPRDYALSADGAEVKGNVLLSEKFSSDGMVGLPGAQIGGDLVCEGGKFRLLNLDTVMVKGAFFWYKVQDARATQLDLRNAWVGGVVDDEASWPDRGNLLLDGFVYEHLMYGPTDARTRLDWLDRQKEFKPQPYRQLAKVLRERGDADGAKQVLFELESRARAEDRRRLVHSPVRWLLQAGEAAVYDATVGYGIYPGRAIWYLGGLTTLGWIVHRRAQRVGAMAPTDKDAYAEFHGSNGKTPVRYQPFSPLIYSIENCVPLVKLGQDERWQPDPNPQRSVSPLARRKFWRAVDSVVDSVVRDWAVTPAALRWFRWIMIGLGWLLATFFVAGLTGIIKVS